MPIEAKEILSYLGMDEKVDSLEKFQETFNPTYIKKDPLVIGEDKEFYGKLMGKKAGTVTGALKRALKRNGLEIKDDEIKDLALEDVAEYVIDKTAKIKGEKIQTLEDQLSKGSDEKQKALQAQLEKATNDFKTLESSYSTIKTEYDTFKHTKDNEIKNFKKGHHVEKLRSSIQWASGVKDDDLKKEGFLALLDRSFKFDLDDKDNLVVTNDKGEKIPNPKMNSTFKSPEEVVKEFAIEKGVWAINPHEQRQAAQTKTLEQFNKTNNGAQVKPPVEGARPRTRNSMIPDRA